MATTPAVVLRGPDGSSVRLDTFPVVLGRSVSGSPAQPDCDLSPLDPHAKISRQHAALDHRDGRVVITDLGSTNGTRLNGRKLEPHQPTPLASQAKLTLGTLTVDVMVDAPAAHPTPVASAPATRPAAASPAGAHAAPGAPAPAGRPSAHPAAAQPPAATQAALQKFVQSIFAALADPAVAHIVLEPRRKLRMRRQGEWVQAGDREVPREAWVAFWNAFCAYAHIDPRSTGYVSRLLGDRIVAECFLPPTAVDPVFSAYKLPAPVSLDTLAGEGLIERALADRIRSTVEAHRGVIITGAARSGRSALTEAIIDLVPKGERIALVERRATVRYSAPNVIRLHSPGTQGGAAVQLGRAVSADWIVIDEADPAAVTALAQTAGGAGPAGIVVARTTQPQEWFRRAAAASGDESSDAAAVTAAFPLVLRVTRGFAGSRVEEVVDA